MTLLHKVSTFEKKNCKAYLDCGEKQFQKIYTLDFIECFGTILEVNLNGII
jgi:hypothetical protein